MWKGDDQHDRLFFNLLLANENLHIARQNLENADKLYEIAVAKRKIGHISESELMQLKLSALQMKGKLTEAQSGLNANMFQLRAFLGLSEQEVIEPILPESAPSLRMIYEVVLQKAQETIRSPRIFVVVSWKPITRSRLPKETAAVSTFLPRSVIPEKTIRSMLPITG